MLDYLKRRTKTMDVNSLLEVLKFLLFVWSIYRYFEQKKREKALVESLTDLNQRLSELEKLVKTLKP